MLLSLSAQGCYQDTFISLWTDKACHCNQQAYVQVCAISWWRSQHTLSTSVDTVTATQACVYGFDRETYSRLSLHCRQLLADAVEQPVML